MKYYPGRGLDPVMSAEKSKIYREYTCTEDMETISTPLGRSNVYSNEVLRERLEYSWKSCG
jgi:hypothetical protein